MSLELKAVLLTFPIAALLLVLIVFVQSLTKPDCPPDLHAYHLSKAMGGGWHCLPPRPCIENRFGAWLFDRKCEGPNSVRL